MSGIFVSPQVQQILEEREDPGWIWWPIFHEGRVGKGKNHHKPLVGFLTFTYSLNSYAYCCLRDDWNFFPPQVQRVSGEKEEPRYV